MSALDQAFIKAYSPGGLREPAPRRSIARAPAAWAEQAPVAEPVLAMETASTIVHVAEPRGSHKPLSSFGSLDRPADALRPQLEVDRFLWPDVCAQLMEQAPIGLSKFARRLISAAAQDQKIVAICGAAREVGATTAMMAIARATARAGATVAMVDGDFARPALASSLGIAAEVGWGSVIHGEISLADALISSIDDRLALLPWLQDAELDARMAINLRAAVTFGQLRDRYDLVLIDAGAVSGPEQGDLTSWAGVVRIEAAYIVARGPQSDDAARAASQLREAGLPVSGVIENFTCADEVAVKPQTAATLRVVTN